MLLHNQVVTMDTTEVKQHQYLTVLSIAMMPYVLIFFLWTASGLMFPLIPLPSHVFGVDLSSFYVTLYTSFFIGYIIISITYLSPNIAKYANRNGKKPPFGNLDRLCCISGCGMIITLWTVITEWNIYVTIQSIIFIILSLILIIWFLIDRRKTHITMKMIFEPLIKIFEVKSESEVEREENSGLDEDNPDKAVDNDPS